MNELLGFVVLTGPLFLIVLWVPVCIVMAFLVGKKFIKKSLTLKIAGGLAFFYCIASSRLRRNCRENLL